MAGSETTVGRRQIVVRRGPVALRWRYRSAIACTVVGLLILAVGTVALMLGDYPLSAPAVWAALIGSPLEPFDRTIVLDWRLSRVWAAIIFGAGLGAAGAIFQALTRNPLASPDVIGFSTGSYTGAIFVIIAGGGYLQIAAGALVGGIATAIAVYLLAWRHGVQGFRLIIVGIAITAMLSSFNTWLLLTAKPELAVSAAVWGAGTLNEIDWNAAALGGAVICLLFMALAALGPALHQLELGDDAAKATGVAAERVRLVAILVGVGLTATVTAAAGPIAFIALSAPQIALRLARSEGVTIIVAAFVGALLLLVADVVGQHVLPVNMPVGIVTVVIGGGYLVWLIIHEVRRYA